MVRIALVVTVAVLSLAAPLYAQDAAPLKRVEIGVDMGFQRSQPHDLLRRTNSPISVRYGAINSEYRFTIDQRVTIGDRRLTDAPDIYALESQLGWRLGSRKRLDRSVLGPYLFGAFNLTSKANHFRDAKAPNGPLFGYAAGIGTRLMIFHTVIRPEVFMAYDPGAGARGDEFWLPSRSSFGLRLGYGWQLPIAND